MNITDLITRLIALRAEHGDLWVKTYIFDRDYGDYQEDPDPRISADGTTLFL